MQTTRKALFRFVVTALPPSKNHSSRPLRYQRTERRILLFRLYTITYFGVNHINTGIPFAFQCRISKEPIDEPT